MAEISGTCDERFGSVRDTLAGNLDQGLDVGASVAVALSPSNCARSRCAQAASGKSASASPRHSASTCR